MSSNFSIEQFLPAVTGRSQSLLSADLEAHRTELTEKISGASILAVGGAGTIGASFVKALLAYKPKKIVVIDGSENGLAEQIRDLRSTHSITVPDDFITYPVSYADPVAAKIIAHHGPFDIVANFAAHKHVRSEKDIYSIEAMLDNNVFRANRFMEAIVKQKPHRIFAVSTDKATNPVNIMGASKKLMEDMLLAYAKESPVTTARFANVAFSNGSLLQAFLERLAKGQPLSAPNDVRRYFVTPEESGQICMMACLLGQSGEIFFPILNETADARRFSDIAVSLLETLKLEPLICQSEDEARECAAGRQDTDKTYPVFFFGSDTTGEKPLEEFYAEEETVATDRYHALGVVQPEIHGKQRPILPFLKELEAGFASQGVSKAEVVDALTRYFGEFGHLETGKTIDSRM